MKKVISLILCMLLMCSISGAAQQIVTKTTNQKTSTHTLDDDVPVWEVGNSWKYDIDQFFLSIGGTAEAIEFDANIDNCLFKVSEVTGTSYELDVSGKIKGTFSYDNGAGTYFKGNLLFTRLSGSMQIRKADLAAEEEFFEIKTIAILTEQSIIPISIPIPIPLTISISIEHISPRTVIDFPLYDGKINLLPTASISANILVESFVLRIAHIFFPDIPSEMLITQEVDIPMLPYSANVEEITVKAGTYNAYNIEFLLGLLGSIYYAPDAGNIIKMDADVEYPGEFSVSLHTELKDTNYS